MSQQRPAEIMQMPMPRQEPPAYYTDQVQVMTTQFSCVLICSRVVGMDKENRVHLKPECVLYMSPQHMKSLWLLLGKQIAGIEERRGEIVLDDEVQG